jgi:hypothetical protein
MELRSRAFGTRSSLVSLEQWAGASRLPGPSLGSNPSTWVRGFDVTWWHEKSPPGQEPGGRYGARGIRTPKPFRALAFEASAIPFCQRSKHHRDGSLVDTVESSRDEALAPAPVRRIGRGWPVVWMSLAAFAALQIGAPGLSCGHEPDGSRSSLDSAIASDGFLKASRASARTCGSHPGDTLLWPHSRPFNRGARIELRSRA